MSESRAGAAAAVVAGKIYVCGGANGTQELRSTEQFNPFSLRWQRAPPMVDARRDMASVALAGKLYLCGGFGGALRSEGYGGAVRSEKGPLASVVRLDPLQETWEMLPSMLTSRTG